MHIEAKKEASKRPWVAGFVYLGRFRRSACPSLRRIDAVTCQRSRRMKLARMRTCGGGGTCETAVVGCLLLCCTCARGLRMPPCLSCSWKFPLSAEIAACVAGVEIRGRARRPALSRCHAHASVKTCIERERRERERPPPSVLCSSFRPLAWRRPWRGRGRQGRERAGGTA